MEWVEEFECDSKFCPGCGMPEGDSHSVDCEVGNALSTAKAAFTLDKSKE